MKFERLADVIDLYKFSLGSMTYCVDRMRPTLEQRGDNRAVELADYAREKIDQARQHQYDWEKRDQQDPLRRDGAKSLDDRIDRALSQIAGTAERFADMEVDTETNRLAEELSDDLFPNGVYHITSKPFDDQHVAVNELLKRLTGAYAEHIDALNLTPLVEHLEQVNKQFGEELAPAANEVTYDEVESAKNEAEDAFHLLVARVMSEFGDDMETFNDIFEPIGEQTMRARRHYKHRGTIPEIDPETGEPVDPIAETEDEPQNDGGSSQGEAESDDQTESDGTNNPDGDTEVDGESDTDDGTDPES